MKVFFASSKRVKKLRGDIIKEVIKSSANGAKAREDLGSVLHTLQDYYSHSTWVEQQIFSNLPLIIDHRLSNAIIIPSNQFPSLGNTCPAPGIPPGPYIYTTGHTDPEKIFPLNLCRTAPDFAISHGERCVHGVVQLLPCHLLNINANVTGINKDNWTREFFDEAKALAIEATRDFIQKIIDEINNDMALDNAAKDAAKRALLDQEEVKAFKFKLCHGPSQVGGFQELDTFSVVPELFDGGDFIFEPGHPTSIQEIFISIWDIGGTQGTPGAPFLEVSSIRHILADELPKEDYGFGPFSFNLSDVVSDIYDPATGIWTFPFRTTENDGGFPFTYNPEDNTGGWMVNITVAWYDQFFLGGNQISDTF